MIAEEYLTKETQSPYLPGTNIQFAWDSTSLGLLKTCPRLYYYTIIEGYAPRGESIHPRCPAGRRAAVPTTVPRRHNVPHSAG